jgi:aldehyde:ferredoxin oxidoreductase
MSGKAPLGYNGKILRVNLTDGTTTDEALDELFCRRYLGGAGFVYYYLWKELKPGIDPLSPDNKIVFALGPLSGLQLPGSSRNCIGTKSALTGSIAKAEAGGFWPSELKRAGYDAIIVEGKADKPVYLWIQDGEVSIRDARHLWGMETKETEAAVRDELGDKRIHLALIGPGGENMVRYACVMNGLHDAAARGGPGAIMGSKNLKAIAVRGHKMPKIADSEHIKEIRQQMLSRPLMPWLTEFGTGGPETVDLESAGNLPVRNFRDGLFPEIKQIHSGVMKEESIIIGMEGCFACPVRCKKVLKFEEPYPVDPAYGGPEYETIAALGSDCGVGNLKAIVKANERCGAYSLDTISTGGTIAFAMECFEKGLLTTKDTDGIDLRFGNDEAMLQVIDLIARRQGIGNLLAEGSARMAKKIGKGSEAFAIQVKGLEAGMHEPRLSGGFALGYMVAPQGADHCAAVLDFLFLSEPMINAVHHLGIIDSYLPPDDIGPRKVAIAKLVMLRNIVNDSTVVCAFLDYTLDRQAELLKAVTGWETGAVELLITAERIVNIARLFNIREGFTAADDMLPERFFQPKTDGALSDKPLDRAKIDKAKAYYYRMMGWDDKGVPLPEKAAELGIQ